MIAATPSLTLPQRRFPARRIDVLFVVVIAFCGLGLFAAPSPAAIHHAFVTSSFDHTGALGGAAGADAICQGLAEAAGLSTGTELFVAWLSTSTDDAWCRLQGLTGKRTGPTPCNGAALPGAGPWARPGEPTAWAESLDQLASVGPLMPLNRNENGLLVTTGTADFPYTGTEFDGTVSTIGTCSDWTTASSGAFGAQGGVWATRQWWSTLFAGACNQQVHLYCLETGPGPAIPRQPFAPAALAFHSQARQDGQLGGLAGADLICRQEAQAAHLPSPESFFALMSMSGVDAASRLPDAPGFRRVDDYLIGASRATLLSGFLDTTLTVHADGTSPDIPWTRAWTGSDAAGTALGNHCTSWSSTSGVGAVGYPQWATGGWLQGGEDLACDGVSSNLYCFSTRTVLFWENFERQSLSRWSTTAP